MPKNLQTMKTVEEVVNALDEYSRYMSAEEYHTYLSAVAEDNQRPKANSAKTKTSTEPLHPITSCHALRQHRLHKNRYLFCRLGPSSRTTLDETQKRLVQLNSS